MARRRVWAYRGMAGCDFASPLQEIRDASRCPACSQAAAAPDVDAITLDSPAQSVMTDLTKVKAATTSPATTLRQAEQLMIYQGVRMLFVVREMPNLGVAGGL